MKKMSTIFLLVILSCGPSEAEIQARIEQATSTTTSSTTTTTQYLVQNPILAEESIEPFLPWVERYSPFECPEAPPPKKELFLVNFSSIPDKNFIECYNYALSKNIPTENEIILIIYPVGDYVGEVRNNDTPYRGPGFVPVLKENEISIIKEKVIEFYGPQCDVTQTAYELGRFAELGGGQQVQSADCQNLSYKRTVVISLDPERQNIPIELKFTFFHEIFHALEVPHPGPSCLYSDSPEDSMFLHEGGASYYGWVTAASIENIPKDQIMGEWIKLLRHLIAIGDTTEEFEDPAIAEKAAMGLYLLVQRGDLDEELLLNGTIFSTCNGNYFNNEMISIAKAYWYDAEVINGKVIFSDEALSK